MTKAIPVRRFFLGFLSFTLTLSALLPPAQVNADACSSRNGLGLNCSIGYFSGSKRTSGTNVLSPPALLDVFNAEQLIVKINGHLGCSGGAVRPGQNGTGAAFIVLTMLGYPAGTSKNTACQTSVRQQWDATVRYFAPSTNYNELYYFAGINTLSSINDVHYYISSEKSATSIVFHDPHTGAPLYAIKKECANPVGKLNKLELPKNYSLTPNVDNISPPEIESGGKMNVSTSVNTAGEVNSQPTRWEITQMIVAPGKKAPHEDENGTISGEAPCQAHGGGASGNYFASGDSECRNVKKGTDTFNLPPNSSPHPSANNIDIGDIEVGTRLCYALSVQPRSNSDNRWAHSKPVCTVVGKKPKLQIWGGDVSVGGKIETNTSIKGGNVFGSWVEYGAFSVGLNTKFASGAGLNSQSSNAQADWSNLTFANRDVAGVPPYGGYAASLDLPTMAQFFDSQNKLALGSSSIYLDQDVSFKTGSTVVVRTVGDLTISGGALPLGRSIVILSSGTVTIADDIKYSDGEINNINDIPQLVIIAKNIRIQGDVKRIDAWLVASDTINTCYNFTGNLTSEKCKDRLRVNGPVAAAHLILNRTGGSGTGSASGDPAELFNLRPDAHMWAYGQSRGSSKAQTVYSIELPPRF